jgi:glycosyltransferase involved in cell wall biosynthesis
MPSEASRPLTLLLTSNTAWNLAHFRAPILRALLEKGLRVVAAAPTDATAIDLQKMGCQFERLSMSAHGLSPIKDLILLWRYLTLLRRHQPAAILSFTVKPNIYGGIAARLLGVPQLANVSGLGTAFIRGGLLGLLVQKLYKVALRRAQTVFFQNSDDRDFFLARRLVRQHQAALLPGSGVDLQHYAPVEAENATAEERAATNQRPFVFLFIGRLLADKGLLELVHAMTLLQADKLQALNACLIILGPDGGTNPSAISPALLAQWRQNPQLEILGPSKDVRPFISIADCVVLPSYREGTPRSLLEAAAMAKPLIATDVPGCRQVVRNNLNGYLCRVRDAHDLARAMGQIIDLSPSARFAMGQASRKVAEVAFDERLVVQRYLDALDLKEEPDCFFQSGR